MCVKINKLKMEFERENIYAIQSEYIFYDKKLL